LREGRKSDEQHQRHCKQVRFSSHRLKVQSEC
jgi:hypothetical protein